MTFPAREPRVPDDMVLIGRLGAVHGIHGELKLFSMSDVPGRFDNLREVFWIGTKGEPKPLKVKSLRALPAHYLICFEGWDVRETAAELSNGLLALPLARRGELPPGVYFLDDILGLEVCDESGRRLGAVTEIYQTGAHDVYAVRDGDRELLLPALPSVVLSIDLAGRRMTVRVPEGLEA
jgi:16S rRNA processing protein RimM